MTEPSPHSRLISVIIPAYCEASVVGGVIERVRKVMESEHLDYEIICVDDGSPDETARVAREAGASVIAHPYNIGNGAAVKTGIRASRGDRLVILDGDGQHPPEDIPGLLEQLNRFDMAVGARTRASDTSWHRDLANGIYNTMAGYVCGRPIADLTSGFRAVKGSIARGFVYLLPNTFSYPTTLTLALTRSGYSLTFVPITMVKRVGRSKISLLKDGSRFLLIIMKVATLFSPLRVFLPVSLAMFFLGLGYGLLRIFYFGVSYGPTAALLMTAAVIVFMVGLVSEQVAQLRFERSPFTSGS